MNRRLGLLAALVLVGLVVWLGVRLFTGGEGQSHQGAVPDRVQDAGSGYDGFRGETAPPSAPLLVPSKGDEAARSAGDPRDGALCVHTRWHDGQAAPGIGVRLVDWKRGNARIAFRQGVTDAKGDCTFVPVRAGTVTVSTDRGPEVTAVCTAGVTTDVDIVIPPGRSVTVEVRDSASMPLAGAHVWVSSYLNTRYGAIVGDTDTSGRLVVRDVGEARFVAARAENYAESAAYWLGDKGGDPSVLITLSSACGTERGRVVSESGAPVPDALVVVGGQFGWPLAADSGAPPLSQGPPPLRQHTGADGSFLLDSLPIGNTELVVRAEGFAPSVQPLLVAKGPATIPDIVLHPGCEIRGTVRDADGQPVGEAELMIGEYSSYAAPYSRSGTDGSYALLDVAPGAVDVKAYHRVLGRASAQLECKDDAATEWNPVLEPGRQLRGTVHDATRLAVPGARVDIAASDAGSRWADSVSTDEGGAFEVSNVQAEKVNVTIYLPGGALPAFVSAPLPAWDGSQDFVIEGAAGRFNTVTGTIVGSASEAGKAVEILVLRTDTSDVVAANAIVGGEPFRVGDLPDGHYSIRVRLARQERAVRDDVVLKDGEQRDLGTIDIGAESGSLAVRVRLEGLTAEEATAHQLAVAVLEPSGIQVAERPVTTTDVQEIHDIRPGDYLVELQGTGLALEAHRAVVRAGEVTEVELTARTGTRVNLSLHGTGCGDGQSWLVRLTERGGGLSYATGGLCQPNGDVRVGMRVAGGTYDLELELVDDPTRRFTGEVTVAPMPDGAAHPYELTVVEAPKPAK